MKKLWLLLIAMCCSAVMAFSQSAAFKFTDKNDTYDFGTVVDGASVTHEFEFTNVGNQPLVIYEVSATCGCTKPEFSKSPVLPGKKGVIKVTFDSAGKVGKAQKEIYIKSNAPSKKEGSAFYVINLNGMVKAK